MLEQVVAAGLRLARHDARLSLARDRQACGSSADCRARAPGPACAAPIRSTTTSAPGRRCAHQRHVVLAGRSSSQCIAATVAAPSAKRSRPALLPQASTARPLPDSRAAHSSSGSWLPATIGGAPRAALRPASRLSPRARRRPARAETGACPSRARAAAHCAARGRRCGVPSGADRRRPRACPSSRGATRADGFAAARADSRTRSASRYLPARTDSRDSRRATATARATIRTRRHDVRQRELRRGGSPRRAARASAACTGRRPAPARATPAPSLQEELHDRHDRHDEQQQRHVGLRFLDTCGRGCRRTAARAGISSDHRQQDRRGSGRTRARRTGTGCRPAGSGANESVR